MATLTSAAGTNQLVNQAYSQGQQLQNMYNAQSGQAQGQYQNSYNQAQGAEQDLQNYTRQIAGKNFGDIYGQDLTNAQAMYGFDPKSLLQANQALAHTQTTLANLPQAIQQQGNYYGTTAGAEAGNYANLAGNLNNVQQGQANAVNAFQNVLAATQQQANQQTNQQLAGQQQALSGFQASANNATSIMQNAGTVMNNIEQLQQQQGYITAQQVAAYQNAFSQYQSAQAALSQAAAANTTAQAVSRLDAAQAAYYNQQVQEAQNSTGANNNRSGTITIQGNGPTPQSRNSASILGSLQGGGGFSLQGGYL